ncbi:MAG: MFS transporter, partial [Kiloniellales bacterium]
MIGHVRYPLWLHRAVAPGAKVFALLFMLESVARASIAALIPLEAYRILGAAREVSFLYTLVGVIGVIGSLAIPFLVRALRRRWVYSLGAGSLMVAAGLMASDTFSGFTLGILLRVFGVACLNITLSLYVMDYIRRRDLVRSEPLRLGASGLSWTLGPWLGVALAERYGAEAAYLFSAASAAAVLAVFWLLRLQDNPAVAAATKPPPNPLASIGRFLAQPRLRLAWLIAFGRSSFWSMFFVYTPIVVVAGGESREAGAIVVSAGNAMLICSPLFGRLGARFGLRPIIVAAFLAMAGCLAAAALLVGGPALPTAVALLAATVAASSLDAVGGIPFLRSVRP